MTDAPDGGEPGLYINPERVGQLQHLGASLPYKSLLDLLGSGAIKTVAYSDFGGDSGACCYETFVTYVAGWSTQQLVVRGLKALRAKRGIPERVLNYKNRKDRLKKGLIRPWLTQFRIQPGLIIVSCVAKKAMNAVRAEARAAREALLAQVRGRGWRVKLTTIDRLANAAAPLGIFSHLLVDDSQFIWMCDRDAIFDVDERRHAKSVVHQLVSGIAKVKLKSFGFVTCPPNDHETNPDWDLMLSFPDLVAGAFAAALAAPLSASKAFRDVDTETEEIITAFGGFDIPWVAGGTSCRALVYVWDIDDVTNLVNAIRVDVQTKKRPTSSP